MPEHKKIKVDFDDPESVKKTMAKALDCDPGDLSIEESHYSDFTGDTYYKVELGSQEYYVAKDEDSAHSLAIAMVKQDLEEEPEIFNQSFIESHIDTERLKQSLYSDIQNSNYEYYDEMRDRDLKREVESRLRLDEEDYLDEDGEFKNRDEIVGQLADDLTEEQLNDPMAYLEDIYGKEDAVKKAIEIAGIDINAAADEAVSADGMGHFLSPYDGDVHDAPGGLVYWRHN